MRPDSPLKSFADVVEAARADPGGLTISTSGTGGQWHEFAAVVARAAGIELRYVPYNSGQLATLAGLNGEVDITAAVCTKHPVRRRRATRPAAADQSCGHRHAQRPHHAVAWSTLSRTFGNQLPPSGAYNLGIRRDTPPEIIRQVEAAFAAAAGSEAFRAQVAERHFAVDLLLGPDADRRAAQLETISANVFEELVIPVRRQPRNWSSPAGRVRSMVRRRRLSRPPDS